MEQIPISTRGYNWGSTAFIDTDLVFSTHGKQVFSVPLDQVANSVVNAKTEVGLEFAPARREKGDRVHEDTLVEMRFYVPGGVTEGSKSLLIQIKSGLKKTQGSSKMLRKLKLKKRFYKI